ncbi:MAG: aquaporin family protein [Propionibacteriaceae bacterium]|jgi:glycerol uptake facilitator protein|nr:aquaporin family protein [Propionibacteriaceae bacterium]
MPLELSLGSVFLSEFVGTAILLLLGAGVCCAVSFNQSKAKGSGWSAITWGWGIAVFAGVLTAAKTGGHLNPAVTLGLVANSLASDPVEASCSSATRWFVAPADGDCANAIAITGATVGIYILAQLCGAFVGAALAWLAFKKQFDIDQPAGSKLGVFSTSPAIRSYGWNAVTEALAAFVLVFVVLAAGNFSGGGTPVVNMGWLGALGVAILIVGIGLSLGGPTGYAINPARDLGPRLWHAVMPAPNKGGSDWAYAWVPVVGPVVGGVLAGLAATFLLV